jgi:hypothetical protein
MSKLFRDDNGQLCTFGKLGTSQVIAVTSTSQQSNAFAAGTTMIRIANTSTAHVHYAISANPTANLTSSATLPINQVEYLEVTGGHEIAFICGTSSTVSVTEIV